MPLNFALTYVWHHLPDLKLIYEAESTETIMLGGRVRDAVTAVIYLPAVRILPKEERKKSPFALPHSLPAAATLSSFLSLCAHAHAV